jgi:hypothetical protein
VGGAWGVCWSFVVVVIGCIVTWTRGICKFFSFSFFFLFCSEVISTKMGSIFVFINLTHP